MRLRWVLLIVCLSLLLVAPIFAQLLASELHVSDQFVTNGGVLVTVYNPGGTTGTVTIYADNKGANGGVLGTHEVPPFFEGSFLVPIDNKLATPTLHAELNSYQLPGFSEAPPVSFHATILNVKDQRLQNGHLLITSLMLPLTAALGFYGCGEGDAQIVADFIKTCTEALTFEREPAGTQTDIEVPDVQGNSPFTNDALKRFALPNGTKRAGEASLTQGQASAAGDLLDVIAVKLETLDGKHLVLVNGAPVVVAVYIGPNMRVDYQVVFAPDGQPALPAALNIKSVLSKGPGILRFRVDHAGTPGAFLQTTLPVPAGSSENLTVNFSADDVAQFTPYVWADLYSDPGKNGVFNPDTDQPQGGSGHTAIRVPFAPVIKAQDQTPAASVQPGKEVIQLEDVTIDQPGYAVAFSSSGFELGAAQLLPGLNVYVLIPVDKQSAGTQVQVKLFYDQPLDGQLVVGVDPQVRVGGQPVQTTIKLT